MYATCTTAPVMYPYAMPVASQLSAPTMNHYSSPVAVVHKLPAPVMFQPVHPADVHLPDGNMAEPAMCLTPPQLSSSPKASSDKLDALQEQIAILTEQVKLLQVENNLRQQNVRNGQDVNVNAVINNKNVSVSAAPHPDNSFVLMNQNIAEPFGYEKDPSLRLNELNHPMFAHEPLPHEVFDKNPMPAHSPHGISYVPGITNTLSVCPTGKNDCKFSASKVANVHDMNHNTHMYGFKPHNKGYAHNVSNSILTHNQPAMYDKMYYDVSSHVNVSKPAAVHQTTHNPLMSNVGHLNVPDHTRYHSLNVFEQRNSNVPDVSCAHDRASQGVYCHSGMFKQEHVPSRAFERPNRDSLSPDDSFESCLTEVSDVPPSRYSFQHSHDHVGNRKHPLEHLLNGNTRQSSYNNCYRGAPSHLGLFSGDVQSVAASSHAHDHHILATGHVPSHSALFSGEINRKFNGDPLEFEAWRIKMCQEIIDKNVKPNIALEYILSQCSGRVKDVVLSMASVEFNTTWQLVTNVMEELKRQFAADHLIKKAIESEIASFPPVTDESSSLGKFINLCMKIDRHKTVCGDISVYDMAEGTSVLRSKLPKHIQEYYGTKWAQYESRFRVSPPLSFFISVIKRYREKAISSRYAPVVPNKDKNVRATNVCADKKVVDLPVLNAAKLESGVSRKLEHGTDRPFASQSDEHDKYCEFHKRGGHAITECRSFIDAPILVRREFAMTRGLCWKCLAVGHVASRCTSSVKCKFCGSSHHSLLHRESIQTKSQDFKPQNARVGCTKICNDPLSSSYCTKVMLVDLSLASDPSNTIRVYAALDDQSDTTVVDDRLVEYFGGNYPSREITTRFVTNKAVFRHEAKVLPDLRIQGVGCKRYEILKGALSYPSVSNNKHQVASPAVVRRFSHSARFC